MITTRSLRSGRLRTHAVAVGLAGALGGVLLVPPAGADTGSLADTTDSVDPAGPAGSSAHSTRDTAEHPRWRTRLIGEQVLPSGQRADGMPVGELSGIDYDGRSGQWFAIADDSEQAPARFFTARLDLDAAGLHDVDVTGATPLRRTDGSVFPSMDSDDSEVADPESIRVSPLTGTLYWSSEGRRDVSEPGSPRLTDPWVRQASRRGHYLRQFGPVDTLRMSAKERGPRDNQTFEAMTFSADGRQVVTAMEGPLYQDGPEANADHTAVTRLTFFDALTGRSTRQLPYELSAVDGNGVVELVAVDRHRYLVLERAFSADVGNTVRLFEIDLRGATDVSERDSLADGDYRAVRKREVVDFADLGLSKVDNIEGMGWGPKLPGGERSLVLCSDDNFNPEDQITQIVALGLRR